MSEIYEKESPQEKREEILVTGDIFAKIRSRKYKPIVNKEEKRVRVVNTKDDSVVLDTTLEDFLNMAKMSHDMSLKTARMLGKFEEEDSTKVAGHG